MMRTMSPMKMYSQARPQGEELVLAHLGLVKRVALHLKARVPAYMELDELIQVGMMGLLEASRVFDASKGVDFENFAHSRVRGAMLDEVRRLSFLPRSAVAFNKTHNETLHALSSELGRAPTQAEIAEYIADRTWLFEAQPLFCTNRGLRHAFSANTLTQYFHYLYKRAGVAGASSHSGRKTFITSLASQGISVFVLASLAGHKSISTTQRYVSVNDDMKRRAVELV